MLFSLLNAIVENKGQGYYAGGYVRDRILGESPKDIDIEVYGMSAGKLHEILSRFGQVDEVGMSFGILKFRDAAGVEYDFSLPRRESKQGKGHKGFLVSADPFMSKIEACGRRDFTINAMLQDPFTGEIFDFFNGQDDLKKGILRATSEHFGDDPLRVIRGLQFCARFNLKADTHTLERCAKLMYEYSTLSLDRIRTEWFKWALKGKYPSAGLQFLKLSGWSELYPALHNMIMCLQSPVFHAEGCAWIHTCMVCDEATKISVRENLNNEQRLTLMFSALLHDVGKPGSSQGTYPDISSHGHPEYGEPIAAEFLESIGSPKWLIEKVKPLVRNHMRYLGCDNKRCVRRLAIDMGESNISELCNLIEADHRGRIPTGGLPDKAVKMLELSQQEKVYEKKQDELLKGRDLLALGLTPGPLYGKILKRAYELQVSGNLTTIEEALMWAKEFIK